MKILYITRKFPPAVGGMEVLSQAIARAFDRHAELHLIAWGGSQLHLPWFIPWAMVRAFFRLLFHPADVLVIGDGLLSPFGVILRAVFRMPAMVVIHGLDITFKFPLYQTLIPWCLRRFDQCVCISRATEQELLKRGVLPSRSTVLPCGITPLDDDGSEGQDAARESLSRRFNRDLSGKKILLTVGRLVRRKGVEYCVAEILPRVIATHPDVLYIVVGEGKRREAIARVVQDACLGDHVLLTGGVDSEVLRQCLRCADIFIMPNISVPGDAEGFGIVALEASAAGLPVIASNLEGIRDAIIDGENGRLIAPGDTAAFVEAIVSLLCDPPGRLAAGARGKEFTVRNYHWDQVGDRYFELVRGLGGQG